VNLRALEFFFFAALALFLPGTLLRAALSSEAAASYVFRAKGAAFKSRVGANALG
jgi:hypothetical protein